MPNLLAKRLCILALAASASAGIAHAKPFDLIYADRVEVTNQPSISGFSYGNDIGLVVNTQATDITASDLSGASFTASSPTPGVRVVVLLSNEGAAAPIHTGEAVGTLLPGSVLPALVHPGETLRNTFPAGILWLLVDYPAGFTGTAEVNVSMTMGADVVSYLLTIVATAGQDFGIAVTHAGRASSSGVTASRRSSWGAIKKLYR